MDKPMDEADRKHCLLDLHGIRERISPEAASVEFVRRWGPQLESILTEEPESERIDPQEHHDLAADLTREEARASALEGAIEDAIKALDDITVFDAQGREKIDAVITLMESRL